MLAVWSVQVEISEEHTGAGTGHNKEGQRPPPSYLPPQLLPVILTVKYTSLSQTEKQMKVISIYFLRQ